MTFPETASYVLTFVAIAIALGLSVGVAAHLVRLARSERVRAIMNRSLASLLVAGGSWMALS